jgi:hypothetical protein
MQHLEAATMHDPAKILEKLSLDDVPSTLVVFSSLPV